MKGLDGHSGRLELVVAHENGLPPTTHSSPYSLILTSVQLQDSESYGIIEPGAKVNARTTLKNIGGMPSPLHQDISLTLLDNEFVAVEASKATQLLPRGIPSSHSVTVPEQFSFLVRKDAHVQNLNQISVGAPLKYEASLEHSAVVSRVLKEIPAIQSQRAEFSIRYPVELSMVLGASAIVQGAEAPFVFCVKNVSKRELGINSETGRALLAHFRLYSTREAALLAVNAHPAVSSASHTNLNLLNEGDDERSRSYNRSSRLNSQGAKDATRYNDDDDDENDENDEDDIEDEDNDDLLSSSGDVSYKHSKRKLALKKGADIEEDEEDDFINDNEDEINNVNEEVLCLCGANIDEGYQGQWLKCHNSYCMVSS